MNASTAIKYAPLEFDRRVQIWRRFLFENPNAIGAELSHNFICEDDMEYLAVHPFNGLCRCLGVNIARPDNLRVY